MTAVTLWLVALGIIGQSADDLRFRPMDTGSKRDESIKLWGISMHSESRDLSRIEVFIGLINGLALTWTNGADIVGEFVATRPTAGWLLEQRIVGETISRRANVTLSSDVRKGACAAVALRTNRRVTNIPPVTAFASMRLTEVPYAGSISDCPAEMFAADEHVGDVLLRTCARPKQVPGEWDIGRPIDMITVAARNTLVEAIWINRLDTGPSFPVVSPASACGQANDLFAEPRSIRNESVELTWADDGSLVMVESFIDDVREGLFFVFYRDATPAVFGAYRDGLMHGTWGWLDRNGVLVEAREYTLGVKIADLAIEQD